MKYILKSLLFLFLIIANTCYSQENQHYFYQNGEKVYYPSHPNELLVIIKSNENIATEKDISEFEASIKSQGLIIYKTFLEMPSPDSKEYMKYRSVSPSIRKQIIIKKEDGSVFNANSCAELAFLRQLEQVEYAGPLIMINNSYYDAFTYDHFINLNYPLKNIDDETLNKLLKGIDERYFFDEKNYRIVLPPETNKNVPQIMEKIIGSGISEPLFMSVMRFIKTQSNIDPKTISQLNSSDTLKHDYFIYGGVEVTYNKDWDRIGVVFESNHSDYSTFTSKYKLKADNQNQYDHQNFTVFQFTESLSIEERRKVIETIRKEKYVSIVGDLLYWDPNSTPTIIPEEIIVRWKKEMADSERINKFMEEEELEEIRKQKSLNVSILKVHHPFNFRVIEVCNKLMDSGLVTFAEPNFDFQVIKGSSYNSQFKTTNLDYYTRGNQKVEFQKKTNFIGVAFKNEMPNESVLKLIDDWDMTIDAVYMNGLFFVLKFPVNLSSDIIKTIRESIILSKEVTTVGDILIQTENNLILGTQDLIIKWKSETSEAVKQTFIKQYGLTEIRKIPYITGGFQYRIKPYAAYASTDICLKLLETGIVEFAEPVIISTSEDD